MFDSDSASTPQRKTGCPKVDCRSSDALAVYENNTAHCFSCGTNLYKVSERHPEIWQRTWGNQQPIGEQRVSNSYNREYSVDPIEAAIKRWETATTNIPLNSRGISLKMVNKYEMRFIVVGKRITHHLYPYKNDHGDIVGYKERDVNTKQFSYHQMTDKQPVILFGMHLKPKGAKKVMILEGELDVPSAEMLLDKYGKSTSFVSLISGADSAIKTFEHKPNFEYVNSADEIIICMDNDKAGKKAQEKLSRLFDPRKIRLMADTGHYKDANEALTSDEEEVKAQFINNFFKAEKYVPKGIVSASEQKTSALNPKSYISYEYPFEELNKLLYGSRVEELVSWLAQTGVGKTSIFENIQYHWLKKYPELKIANISIEKSPDETLRSVLSLEVKELLNHPEVLPLLPEKNLEDEYDALFGNAENSKFYLYDAWGSIEIDELVDAVRYYANVLDCDFIFFDHISMAVSDQRHLDERKALDEITTKLAGLVKEVGIGLHVVSHMNDDGQARGSRNIDKVSWIRVDLERDLKNPDPIIRNTIEMTVTKNRPIGATGPAGFYYWNGGAGGLLEAISPEENTEEKSESYDANKDKDMLSRFERDIEDKNMKDNL